MINLLLLHLILNLTAFPKGSICNFQRQRLCYLMTFIGNKPNLSRKTEDRKKLQIATVNLRQLIKFKNQLNKLL